MRYTTRAGGFGTIPGGMQFRVTPWVKRLLVANAAVFVVSLVAGRGLVTDLLGFSPGNLLYRPWGMLTYMFVHWNLWHLLMNLLVVFFFGPPLESRWGSELFMKFYLVCGLGGVLLSFAFTDARIVGASAACYGLMLAFAMTWPNAPIHIYGIVPVKAKWVVGFLAVLSFGSAVGPRQPGDNLAHLAHLGGLVAGFLFLKSGWMEPRGRGTLRREGDSARYGGSAGGWNPFAGTVRRTGVRRKSDRRAARERDDLDAVDAVLDKISAHGIQSLTDAERDLLDKMSRKTRTN